MEDLENSSSVPPFNPVMWLVGTLAGFAICAFFVIPLGSFKEIVFQKIEQQTKIKMRADNMGIGFPPSLKFSNLRVDASKTISLDFQELNVLPALIDSISGTPAVEIWGVAYGGKFKAKLKQDATTDVDLLTNDLQYRKMTFLPYHKDINFLVNTQIKVNFPSQKARVLSGDITLDIKGISIQETTIQGFDIPSLRISKSLVKIKAEKGILKINTKSFLGQQTDPLEIKIPGGEINLLRERATIPIELRLSDQLMKSFGILDLLLSRFKVPGKKNTFKFKLTGSLYALQPVPF